MEKYRVLYNPLSGNGRGEKNVKKLNEVLQGDLITYDDITLITDYKKYLSGISKDEKLVIAGGDGTICRFANYIDFHPERDIYYYPTGSGNDFFRDISKGETKPVCINKYIENLPSVTVNGRTMKFINGVGYGVDGYCCVEGDKIRAESDKKVNYPLIAIKGCLFYYKPTNATVTVDGKTYKYEKVWLAPVMKGRFYGGGIMAAPNQDRLEESGKITLVAIHGFNKLQIMMAFPTLFTGKHTKYTKNIHFIEGYDIKVEFDRPSPLQIDGEAIEGVTSFEASAVKEIGYNNLII